MRRVAVIGGGVWVPALARALGAAGLRDVELRLAARRWDRLERIAALTPPVAGGRVVAVRNARAALEGADVVLLAPRVGGFAARDEDERFPTAFGRVGDEGLGLGGLANAWRTLPVLAALADEITAIAPAAVVLDLVAPLGVTTRALRDAGLRAFGLCELPARVAQDLGGPCDFAYAGFNHAGWFWPISARGERRVDELLAAAALDPETWDRFGGVPLPHFYDVLAPSAGARLGRPPRRPGRAADLAAEADAVLAGASARRDTPWFALAVAPALRALLDDVAWDGWVNLPQPDVVREVRAAWTRAGPRPQPAPAAPEAVRRWLEGQEIWEQACFAAASRRDPGALGPALAHLGLPPTRWAEATARITRPLEVA